MSAKTLENKIAVVTGGTRGIGRAIALRLLEEGAKVAICGTRQKSVDEAVQFLSSQGVVFGMPADVSKLEDVEAFIAAVMREFGAIQILVNNAGVGIFHSVAEMTPREWERMIGLNLTGAYYCCHAVLPIFKQQGGGDVVNISSLAGRNPFAGGAGYNASKFGLNGFSEAMMHDHRHDGVRVTTILPGSVDTTFGSTGTGTKEGSHTDTNAWKIAPEDIAEAVAMALGLPRRTTVSVIEIRPSRPPARS